MGFLALPVMTAGAAYDLAQIAGWKHSLHAKLGEAKAFYAGERRESVVAGDGTILASDVRPIAEHLGHVANDLLPTLALFARQQFQPSLS